MADVEIRGKISVDTGNSAKSVNEMLESIKQTKAALKDAKVGSAEYQKAQADLAKQTKELNTTLDKSGGSFSKLKDTLGGTIPGFQGASDGASGLGKQLWLLVANPIVAILAGIVAVCILLYKAFTSVEAGADKVGAVMSGISAIFEEVRNRALDLIEGLKKIFSGDFKAGFEEVGQSAKGMGDSIVDAFNRGKEAAEAADEISDRLRVLAVTEAKVSAAMAKNKEIINDETVSYGVKKKAIEETRKALEGLSSTRQDLLDRDVKAFEKEHNLSMKRKEFQDDEAFDEYLQTKLNADQIQEYWDKVTKAINSGEQRASQSRQLQRTERAIDAAQRTKDEAARKQREEEERKQWEAYLAKIKEKSALDKQAVIDEKTVIDQLTTLRNNDLSEKERIVQAEMDLASWRAQRMKFNYDKEKLDQQAALDFKISVLQREAEAVEMFGNILQQFAGKSKALAIAGIVLEKAGAIGRILISGYVANAKSVAAFPLTAGQPFVGIQNVMTGLQVAGTIAAGAKAIGAMGGSDSSGGMTSLSQSVSAPLSPRPVSTNTRLDQSSIQGIGNAAQGGTSRSFVLDTDIKNNAERNARINRAARLG